MIFAVDHIVFAASPSQSRELRDRLAASGFNPEAFSLQFPEIGAESESLSFAGGGFIEFVATLDETRAPRVWFDEIPRIIGLGFSSDKFDLDTKWSTESSAWVMDEDHTLPDGTRLNIHAAGPHPHFSDFYVFVMDRPDGHLQFPERGRGPRLRHLSFRGASAEQWKERLVEWLQLTQDSDSLHVGNVQLTFENTARPGVRVTPVFEGARKGTRFPLSEGTIELLTSAASRRLELGAEDR